MPFATAGSPCGANGGVLVWLAATGSLRGANTGLDVSLAGWLRPFSHVMFDSSPEDADPPHRATGGVPFTCNSACDKSLQERAESAGLFSLLALASSPLCCWGCVSCQ